MTKTMQLPAEETTAARRLAEMFTEETLDSLIKDAVKTGTPIDGADGLLNQLTKAVLERALNAELTHHLGYEAGDPAGRGSGVSFHLCKSGVVHHRTAVGRTEGVFCDQDHAVAG